MTPKEKAEWLIIKMFQPLPASKEAEKGKEHLYYNQYNAAKQCALIAVDEILEATKTKYKWGGGSPEKLVHFEEVKYDTYWKEVKQELEKL
jgi:hypothetical protein